MSVYFVVVISASGGGGGGLRWETCLGAAVIKDALEQALAYTRLFSTLFWSKFYNSILACQIPTKLDSYFPLFNSASL